MVHIYYLSVQNNLTSSALHTCQKTYSNVQHIEKSKVVPVHTMKTYSGSRCTAPYVFSPHCRYVGGGRGSTTCPSCITLQERTPVPIQYEAGQTLRQERKFWRREKSHAPARIQAADCSTTAHLLYQVCYSGSKYMNFQNMTLLAT